MYSIYLNDKPEYTVIMISEPEIICKGKKTCLRNILTITFVIILMINCASCSRNTAGNRRKKLERKTDQNITSFTLFELIEGLKNVNMTKDYNRTDIMTRDISKIDMAVDAAHFLFGLVQTYLENKKPSKTAEIPGITINITNSSNPNINLHHGSNDTFSYKLPEI